MLTASVQARPGRTGSRGLLPVGLACLIVAVGLIPSLFSDVSSDSQASAVTAASSLVVGVCVAALVVVSSRAGTGQGGLLQFRLGPWYLLATLIGFGLASYAWRTTPPGRAQMILPENIVLGLYLVALAVVCWTIGYVLGLPKGLKEGWRRLVGRAVGEGPLRLRSSSVPVLFFLVGLSGYVVQLATGRFGYLSDPRALLESPSPFTQLFGSVAQFTSFGATLAAVVVVQSGFRRGRSLLAGMIVVQAGFGLLAGHKTDFLLALLGPIMVIAISRPALARRALVLGAVAFLFVAQFTESYRNEVRSGSVGVGASRAVDALPDVARDTFLARDPRDVITRSATDVAERLRLIDNVGIVVQKTPGTLPYVGATPILTAPVLGVIPRLVWPSKPVLATGYLFNQQYYEVPATIRSSSAPTNIGDLYRHAGLLAVVTGMVLLGALMRTVDDTVHHGLNLRYILVFLALWVELTAVENGAVALIAGMPKVVVVALVASYLAFARSSTPSARA